MKSISEKDYHKRANAIFKEAIDYANDPTLAKRMLIHDLLKINGRCDCTTFSNGCEVCRLNALIVRSA